MAAIQAIISSSLLLLWLSCITGSAQTLLPTKDSFSLRSSIRSTRNDGCSRVIYLRESYSREQNRATFHFDSVLVNPQIGTANESSVSALGKEKFYLVYMDLSGPATLVMVSERNYCSSIRVDHLQPMLELTNYLPPASQPSDPLIVGAAQLLSFSRSQLRKSKLDTRLQVRNIPTDAYEILYKSQLGDQIHMLVIYAKQSVSNNQQSIPVQIILGRSNGDSLVIDFGHLQLLSTGVNPSRRVDDVELDEFALDPDFGCSQSLGARVELFAGANAERLQLSFSANGEKNPIFESSVSGREMFVAYDARLDSLRVDSWTSETRSRRQVELFNFALNLRYDVGVRDLDESTRRADGVGAQCLSGRMRTIQDGDYSDDKRLSPGKLLFGADRFAYEGRARVRGLEAKMFKAQVEVAMPFWIGQPVPVRHKDRQTEFEHFNEDKSSSQLARKLTIVLYVAGQSAGSLPIPLQLDTVEGNRGKSFYSHRSMSIYSFAWHLGADGPFGDRASELFSLADMCAAGLDSNLFARVHLLLEQESQLVDSEEHPTALQRHSALLGALQRQLHLPASLVFDVQSRVGDGNTIEVSFRVADHLSSFVQPIYLGSGRWNHSYTGSKLRTQVRYFHECLMLAARQKLDVYFGYDSDTRLCSVDLAPNLTPPGDFRPPSTAPKVPIPTWPLSFEKAEGYPTGIFKVKHIDLNRARARNWINEGENQVKDQRLVGKRLKLVGYPAEGDSEWLIKRSHVDERDLRYPLTSDSLANRWQSMDAIAADRLVGYTFVDGADGNRKVSAEDLATDRWTNMHSSASGQSTERQMTFELCQATCLSDFDCQSFSVCVRAGQFERNLSQTNFCSPDTVEQFQRELRKSPKSDRLQVNIDGQQVELLRKRLCTIHIKRYLQMFEELPIAQRSFALRLVHQVGDKEECAQKCLKQTLVTLREEIPKAEEALAPMDGSAGAKEVRQLAFTHTRHRNLLFQFCRKFFYLDRANIDDPATETKLRARTLHSEPDSRQVNGYCLLGVYPSREEEQLLQNLPTTTAKLVDWQMFLFDIDLVYERQFAVRLAASEMTASQAQAYTMLLKGLGDQLTDEQTESLHEFIAEGRNVQEILRVHAHDCARKCFAQTWGPWPVCRSFDVVVRPLASQDVGPAECYLNTVTLAQVVASGRSELIKSGENLADAGDVQVWHCEPRAGLILEDSLLDANLNLARDSASLSSSTAASSYEIHSLGALMLALFGVVSGLLIALQFGSKASELIAPVGGRRRSEGDEQIVDAHPEFESANLRNHESLQMK